MGFQIPRHHGSTLTAPDWNIPKHLARFDINEHPDGSVDFKVFPLDEGGSGADSRPLFQCAFKPWSYTPAFSISTRAAGMFGLDLACVQPPLPAGAGASVETGGADNEFPTGKHTPAALAVAGAEIVGTQRWCKLKPYIYSARSRMGWFDLEQPDGTTFTPGSRRWLLGAKLEDALLTFDEGEWWDTPEAVKQ